MFFTDTVPRKTSWFWRHIVANAGPDIFAHMRRRHSRDGASPNVPFPDGPPNTSIPVAVRIEESENNELKIRWKVESEYGTKSKFDNVSRIRYQISVFHLLPTILYKKKPFSHDWETHVSDTTSDILCSGSTYRRIVLAEGQVVIVASSPSSR